MDNSRAIDGFHLGGIDPAVGDINSVLASDIFRFGTRKGWVGPNGEEEGASSRLIAALEAALRSLLNPCLPGEGDIGGEDPNDEGETRGEMGLISGISERVDVAVVMRHR